MSFLRLTNVSRKYPGQNLAAVNDISFELQKGEILSIVGENGSGKTTLLKIIGGVEDTDGGEVRLLGELVTGPAYNLVPGHAEIKMLAQDLRLMPKHTIIENISYNLRGYVQEFQDERLEYLISLFRLQGLENKRPAQLSGGQQQRAALASALAEEPALLLLDEPFSSLDIMLKDEIRHKVIRQAREDGDTLIFVTHEVKDALSLSDKVAVMKAGKIVQMDRPQAVYEQPRDEYVAYLFGSVNLLSANDLFRAFPELKKNKDLHWNDKVCFRPGKISICASETGINHGLVIGADYMGDTYELEVEVEGVVLKVNSKKCYQRGDKLGIYIHPDDIHVLEE
ncbi:ABC transporter ATP-binding protein [Fulvivirga sp. 29W222]|uniref:ABC transporter ATP-binding protein n=1 Tax=Fulvivirga marina TaxID=2494733 RepID=A0A937FZ67_9BACT|nr:ABC transporter ATP-binding protein [Fulvivirga marina]MBL6447188.1 ABC transporter ATP-binding protein [Fulvivirga marina]